MIFICLVAACAVSGAEKTPLAPRPILRKISAPNDRSPTSPHQAPSLVAHGEGAKPSFRWALLSNWLYYLSLGLNAINMAFLVRQTVNGNLEPSADSISLSGNIEAVDKLLTFLGVGYLCALSDVLGRRPLMLWSALGFALTNLLQASAGSSRLALYIADIIDGCTSCMSPVCQAYLLDCSPPELAATNLGVFQGLSVGGAFIIAFPIGGILGKRYGPRMPLLVAAALQLLNAMVVGFLTPESHHRTERASKPLDLRSANAVGALGRLFAHGRTLRGAAAVYFLLSLARNSLDAQFVNYASVRFGWSQQQAGPVMVLVGLMLAVVPRLMVPLLGLRRSVLSGLLLFAAGLTAAGLAPTPLGFVGGIGVVAVGLVCLPALQAFIASLAAEDERGALLGALGSLNELTAAIGSTMYAAILAHFSSPSASLKLPGMHFLTAAAALLVAWGISTTTLPADRM